jgi:membrane-bound lytic murein transglycosylase D
MRLKAGSTILVPKIDPEEQQKDIGVEVADNATMAVEPDVPDTRRISVKVGKRDTLPSIAKRYKVSVAQIKSWNKLTKDSVARGQVLQLQVPNRLAGGRKKAGKQLAQGSRHVKTAKSSARTAKNAKTANSAKNRRRTARES